MMKILTTSTELESKVNADSIDLSVDNDGEEKQSSCVDVANCTEYMCPRSLKNTELCLIFQGTFLCFEISRRTHV